jgi:hypothetical protein
VSVVDFFVSDTVDANAVVKLAAALSAAEQSETQILATASGAMEM